MSAVVDPIFDHVAAERARLVNVARAELVLSGKAVTVEMLACATHRTAATVRQWVHRHRKAGRLVAVTHGGNVLVPTFQLDEAFDIDNVVSDIVVRLVQYRMSVWAVWDWFETPNTWLDDNTPAGSVAVGDVKAVRRAVAGLFQE